MSIYDKLQEGLNEGLTQGLDTSLNILKKVRSAAADAEEKGLLKMDLHNLNKKKRDLIDELGVKAYESLVVNGKKTVSVNSSGIRELVDEIAVIEGQIAEKEEELKKYK